MSQNSSMVTTNSFNITEWDLPFEGSVTTPGNYPLFEIPCQHIDIDTMTPGYFNFTMSLSPFEASTTIQGDTSQQAAPCGSSPSPFVSTSPTNSAGYSPGWCGIHIEQYQKNEDDENPTSDYEVSILIKDAAGNQIGQATKQDASKPLYVQSKLPHNLIVQLGNVDSDPIFFWYADQYWLTNDNSAHDCKLGGFDSGNRQGDCGFTCSNPTNSPPASATQPLPTGLIKANDGSDPTTLPTAAPTATYAAGWCGVHVRQYQKDEKNENPTDNYEVEVTLYDAKQNVIGTSGQVSAPTDQAVNVQDSLPHVFTLETKAIDKDPLMYSYNGQSWDSANSRGHDCSVGKYDSGYRDIDCGFSCWKYGLGLWSFGGWIFWCLVRCLGVGFRDWHGCEKGLWGINGVYGVGCKKSGNREFWKFNRFFNCYIIVMKWDISYRGCNQKFSESIFPQ